MMNGRSGCGDDSCSQPRGELPVSGRQMKVSRELKQSCSLEIVRAWSCPGVSSRTEQTDGGGVDGVMSGRNGCGDVGCSQPRGDLPVSGRHDEGVQRTQTKL